MSDLQPADVAPQAPAPMPRDDPRDTLAAPEVERFGARRQGALLASLSSVALHLLLMIALGAWMMILESDHPALTIVTSFLSEEEAEDPGQFEDLPVLIESPVVNDSTEMEAVVDDAFADETDRPKLAIDLSALRSPSDLVRAPLDLKAMGLRVPMFAGRQEGVRGELVKRHGGSLASEQAVARGLKWLAIHQNPDGSWSLARFHRAGRCNGRCDGAGKESKVAGTALALLPFLGAGQTHNQGEYQDLVRRGLVWLIEAQRADGDLRGPGNGKMYAHAQATIVLCEALAMTQDSMLSSPAQMAVDYIVAAQHSAGGWRYAPGDLGDTSVHGWQVMALRSAQMAYLEVPSETLEMASRFLDSVQTTSTGGLYSYIQDMPTSRSMSAEGMLCRQYLGWELEHPGFAEGVSALLGDLPRRGSADIYYWYYATQVMHHYGGRAWEVWNESMRDLLIDMQSRQGHTIGSWAPEGDRFDASVGGRIYMTSLALCTLEVYYRHMPLYQSSAVR